MTSRTESARICYTESSSRSYAPSSEPTSNLKSTGLNATTVIDIEGVISWVLGEGREATTGTVCAQRRNQVILHANCRDRTINFNRPGGPTGSPVVRSKNTVRTYRYVSSVMGLAMKRSVFSPKSSKRMSKPYSAYTAYTSKPEYCLCLYQHPSVEEESEDGSRPA